MPPSSDLYKTEVRDAIDADALLLDIDLGLEVIRRQPIGLARIDAPPRDTPQGVPPSQSSRRNEHATPPTSLQCEEQDSNLHAHRTLEPKSSASANSAILASVWNAVVAPFRVRSKAPSYTHFRPRRVGRRRGRSHRVQPRIPGAFHIVGTRHGHVSDR